ncbi:chitinase C-terminal domain-containing protein [Microbulbifer harenosus]|uniref:Glycoside hydrolase n=1 Tax=Microbulbifer harenosus TaxID=2576840 RepID=A0ABY2UKN0_9GAMM|nr:glycosyl hydrolase family 18 protein [Microbulbifer harenosus]TLM76934.1 glycoside hydrolase [Microbulbifer harenosus]
MINNKLRLGLVTAAMLAAGHCFAAVDCSGLPVWQAGASYSGGAEVQYNNNTYRANWWTQNQNPEQYSGQYQEWTLLGSCEGDVDPQLPPEGSISAPLNGSVLTQNDSVIISVSASDPDGHVTTVEFFVNGSLIATDTSAPWESSWTVAAAGPATFTARIVDNDNLSVTTAPVSITVDEDVVVGPVAPSISLTSPANGSSHTTGTSLTISANATDSDGSVSKVEFFVDGDLIATDTSAPYSTQWVATLGDHTVTAVATDNDELTASAGADIEVSDEPVVIGEHPCRPDGLYTTPGTAPNYCDIYDADGREDMGADHPRRIIGYFTSWRNGANGQPSYLVKDIPWGKITHINYAFAHVGSDYSVSVGNTSDPGNPATGMEWPGIAGAETDPDYAYKGHFNQLSKFKEQYPEVKTLVSVGGWAETGGHFNENGDRVADGGFYTMTTNADGSINHAGIEAFANSSVDFIRQYGFDGVDIDYEYPTSMNDAGNPLDFGIANSLRGGLMASYVELMRVLREKLDAAGEADGTHYLLTIASPSSGYLLRGMETMQITQYLDYVNIMTYDLHGAWNEYVGHNSALFDNGNDPELAAASVYSTSQYGGIGYLNIDWAVKYFRGSMPAGRINVGIPYYTRGWQGVSGGTSGLGGSAALPAQSQCPEGTGGSAKCGNGAIGIDNMWHDKNSVGDEMGAGSNPMWHAMNLQQGILGSYLGDYGLDPANDPDDALVGTYVRNYDSVSEAPWLWNAQKSVFISTEDEESMDAKVQYVIDQGVGGIMFWELAGDYDWDAAKGEYFMGDTLTTLAYDKFAGASKYRHLRSDRAVPAEALNIGIEITGFKLGDQNYPLNPKLVITNNTGGTLPGGTIFEFDMPTSTSNIITDQSGAGLEVVEDGANAGGGNVGGLENEFHRVRLSLPAWQNLADGDSWDLTLNYYLPVSGPQAYTATVNGSTYALAFEHPELPLAELGGGDGGSSSGGSSGGGQSCASGATSGLVTYPEWPRGDHAAGGDQIIHNGSVFKANWWTQSVPGTADGSWSFVCSI